DIAPPTACAFFVDGFHTRQNRRGGVAPDEPRVDPYGGAFLGLQAGGQHFVKLRQSLVRKQRQRVGKDAAVDLRPADFGENIGPRRARVQFEQPLDRQSAYHLIAPVGLLQDRFQRVRHGGRLYTFPEEL